MIYRFKYIYLDLLKFLMVKKYKNACSVFDMNTTNRNHFHLTFCVKNKKE